MRPSPDRGNGTGRSCVGVPVRFLPSPDMADEDLKKLDETIAALNALIAKTGSPQLRALMEQLMRRLAKEFPDRRG